MERRSRDLLQAMGYHVVKAGGSLGEWDLVAIGLTDVVLCQVKSTDWPGRLEMAALSEFPVAPFTRRIVHRWRAHQRYPDVQELR